MRQTPLIVAIAVLLAAPAAGQQGSMQIVAGGVVTTGDPARTGGLDGYQSDVGFSWKRPTIDWGTWTIEAHGVRNDSTAQFGRALFAIQGLKRGGTRWNVTAGDTAYMPLLRDYAFTNLFAPQVTFRGASVEALNPKTSFSVTAGRVTLLRDLFAANAEVLGQTLFVARGNHKASERVELVAHVSSVRTEDLKEYSYEIKAGEDAGAGVRFNVSNRVQLIADAGVTSYVRKGEDTRQQKATFLAGARWSDKQGWVQVDAYQFAPGNFSVVNNPYDDRRGLFAGGEYALSRLRIFGGWDLFRRNLEPGVETSYGEGVSSRAYAGVRFPINSHLFLGGRVEDGARTTKPSRYSVGYESDTGVRALDWQITFPKWTAIGRYEQRSSVDTQGLLASTTFNQRDIAGEVFLNITNSSRVIARMLATDRRDEFGTGGQSFWQASAGTEFQVTKRNLYGRAELIVGRSHDFQSPFLLPHTAFSGGLSGQIRTHLSLSVDVYVDRSPVGISKINPWMSRTIGRLIYTLPTGSPSPLASVARAPKGGSETIAGVVFVDWNGNGVQDPDEETLPGVRVELDKDLGAMADGKGRFRFERIASGPHVIAVDLNTVPASFDAPISPLLELSLKRGMPATAAFGVLPLGDVEGVVVRDANGSGAVDDNDEPLDGAVLVLDDGARTEISRKGHFRFPGVRLGAHKIEVLMESLPDGAALAGDRQVEVQVARTQMTATAQFLVKLEKRPEVRKVFPPKKPEPGKADGKAVGTVQDNGGGKSGPTSIKSRASGGSAGSKGRRSRRPNTRGPQTRH